MTSKGVIIFAFNNEKIPYIEFALATLLMVRFHMPQSNTAVITNQESIDWLRTKYSSSVISKAFDHVILDDIVQKTSLISRRSVTINDISAPVMNHNQNTSNAYWLSPFDETLMLDADYLIQNDILDNVWGSANPLMINYDFVKLNHQVIAVSDKKLSPDGIKQLWTTAIYFRRTPSNNIFYNLVDHISENYRFYKYRYHFSRDMYRNDYVFSIANYIMSGFTEDYSYVKPLPDKKMIMAYPTVKIYDVSKEQMKFIDVSSRSSLCHTTKTNVHVLDKISLLSVVDKIVAAYG